MNQKEDIYLYCEEFSNSPSHLLNQLERETYLKTIRPNMISGKLQGRFLSFLSHLVQPKMALEIGTFSGYASLCIAEGLAPDGQLITIEVNPEMETLAQKFFDASDYKEKIKMIIGDASEVITTLDEIFDFVFIDARKTDYSIYFDLIIDKVKSGGIIIADNVIWYGKTMQTHTKSDKQTDALRYFNEKLRNDNRIENLILPLRDGLNIARKI